jgi:hypothetical protein
MTQISFTAKTNVYTPRFEPGPFFTSFDKLKNAGQLALESVKNGVIAKLETKLGRFVILNESDFQSLYGLAQDVQRLSNGLELVYAAVRAVEIHNDEASIATLVQAMKVVGRSPTLPTQVGHEVAEPEGFEVLNTQIELDPKKLTRPV